MSYQQKTTIKWDEETIAEHDKERGTRQKIEEPDTPYERGETIDIGEAADGAIGYVHSSSPAQKSQAINHTDIFNRLNAQLAYVQRQQQRQKDMGKVESSSFQADDPSRYFDKSDEKDKFREKRAGHYGRINLTELRKLVQEQKN